MTDTSTATEPGTVINLDPETLVIAANVRKNVHIDQPFIDSITEHGVLVPITIWWDDIATSWQVLDGQRRTLAARTAHLPTVPCWTVEPIAAEDTRIVNQLVINDHRTPLDDRDETTAVHELALFGLTADTIRRRTRIPRTRVDQALAVATSPAGNELLEQQVTLEQAAALVEFADDPETFDRLQRTAEQSPASLPYAVARAREQHPARLELLRVRAELEATGLTVIDGAAPDPSYLAVWRLRDADGNEVTEEQVRAGLGAVASVSISWQWHPTRVAPAAGESDDDEPEVDDADADQLVGAVKVTYLCSDPAANGWHDHYPNNTVRNPTAPTPSIEEKRAARARTADWRTATTVRVEKLRTLVSNRIPARLHPAAHALLAAHLTDQIPGGMPQKQDTADWLGIPRPDDSAARDYSDYYGLGAYLDQHPDRALNIALARALVDAEHGLSQLKPHQDHTPSAARYLNLAADLGHTLSPIEQHAAGHTTDEQTDSVEDAQP